MLNYYYVKKHTTLKKQQIFLLKLFLLKNIKRAVVAQGHKGVTVTRRLWVRFPLEEINYYFFIFSFLRSVTRANASKNTYPASYERYVKRNFT